MTMFTTRFEVHVSDEVLANLKTRPAQVRWPDEAPDSHWKYGTECSYLKSLVDWREHYQWRVHEAHLNRFAQFKVNAQRSAIEHSHR